MMKYNAQLFFAGISGLATTVIVWFLVKQLYIGFEAPNLIGMFPGVIGGLAGGVVVATLSWRCGWFKAILITAFATLCLTLFPIYTGRQQLYFFYWFSCVVVAGQILGGFVYAKARSLRI